MSSTFFLIGVTGLDGAQPIAPVYPCEPNGPWIVPYVPCPHSNPRLARENNAFALNDLARLLQCHSCLAPIAGPIRDEHFEGTVLKGSLFFKARLATIH